MYPADSSLVRQQRRTTASTRTLTTAVENTSKLLCLILWRRHTVFPYNTCAYNYEITIVCLTQKCECQKLFEKGTPRKEIKQRRFIPLRTSRNLKWHTRNLISQSKDCNPWSLAFLSGDHYHHIPGPESKLKFYPEFVTLENVTLIPTYQP